MKKITNYTILGSKSIEKLTEKVTLFLNDGWQPFGPAQSDTDSCDAFYIQTMVKYET